MPQQLKVGSAIHLGRGGLAVSGMAGPVITIYGQNKSGGTLVLGDVVVWDRTNSTADIIAFKTSTGGNDVDVLGMVFDKSVANDGYGRVQIFGPTKSLKADGTTDIAVGDMLSTFTAAKIAQKSTTGGRFARALEAYTTNDSAGVLDAFITNLTLGAFTTE